MYFSSSDFEPTVHFSAIHLPHPDDSGELGQGQLGSEMESLYLSPSYPPPHSSGPTSSYTSPHNSLARPPPPLVLATGDAGGPWRDEGVRPLLHPAPPVLHAVPASSAAHLEAGVGPSVTAGDMRDNTPMSISQLIGDAMEMEPGEWINYESH
jgi:hypothetical protein